MQSGTDLVTTTQLRHYSLFVLASSAVDEARAAMARAYEAADKNPTYDNINAFLQASNAVDVAEANLRQVQAMKKYLKGTRQ